MNKDTKYKNLKLAFVIPRYSKSIGGGAETLMRALAIELSKRGIQVDILTTCAIDHRTWENHFPEGESVEDGLKIIRFKVDDRDIDRFIKEEQKIAKGFRLTALDQLAWLENSVNSENLYSYLIEHENIYNLYFFAPYLFGTSFWGSMLVANKTVLVPCLHDEGYAYLPIMRAMFRKVKGVMWNSEPEAKLAKEIYRLNELDEKGVVVGMGFDDKVDTGEIKREPNSYFIYSGRKESGKGLDQLISNYSKYSADKVNFPELVLIGSGKIDFLNELPSGVIDLGFVSEEEKIALMRGAICLFQPSLNESFSIVLMEAWTQGTPVIVNSDCAVTKHHVEKSEGGLHYRDYYTFTVCIEEILSSPDKRNKLGINGLEFVKNIYSWNAVIARFKDGVKIWT